MSAQIGRLNHYHNTKRHLVGNHAGAAAPAWKMNQQLAHKKSAPGSKILLSNLPYDVTEGEVESLFKKTVGPTREVCLIYNSAGKSKGMAIVEFTRKEDARLARQKYNNRVIDERRPIYIDIIGGDDVAPLPPPKPEIPSLLQRIGLDASKAPPPPPVNGVKTQGMSNIAARKQQQAAQRVQGQGAVAPKPVAVAPRQKNRTKKGPKRLKKTLEQLDREMDDYRSHTDDPMTKDV
ncbi:hypothetical protein EIP91_002086 [Steccherinum ochraceum]|uniref:RRM domain-containing protein n=1 Tax=Steccherinum ochraceum TaxID=92696 RepID=A0A4R0RPE2_9APHY|nr:hypothetical protein EIP91_002086 [Steccherinum ochraceum]